MKKIFSFAFIIVIFPLFFPLICFAAPTKEEFQNYVNEQWGTSYSNTTDAAYNAMISRINNNPDMPIALIKRSNDYFTICVGSLNTSPGSWSYTVNDNNTITVLAAASLNNIYVNDQWTSQNFTNSSPYLYWENKTAFEMSFINIDFDDIYYSPQIPIPTIDVYMGSDIKNPTSGQAVWNASMEFGDNSQYYIQYGYKTSFPSYIDVGLASLRGDFSYNYYNYTSTNYIDIVPLNSLTTAVNQSKPASYFQDAWQSFYNNYLTQSLLPEFGSQVNAMSSAMLDDAKEYYVDYMLGQIPMYGNRLEVFARYFIIDEENDNRVVVGAWNHWSSKDGSRTKERPSNYIDNVALPGYINTNNDVNYQENEGSFDNVGNTTGVPATIINNNYVPNYPDYPTIASYNKDNLLVSSIDKLNEVKGFFGEFNDFLNVTFVWVPDWIWALIGIGFSLSIIVFFLRML